MKVASYVVLVVTAAVLLYAAANDLRHYKVPNEVVLVLLGLFILYALLLRRWDSLLLDVGFASLMFLVLLVCYARRLMGGGDVKLLAVAFLWTGVHCALPFAALMFVFSMIYLVAVRLEWVNAQEVEGRRKIAFAPSIAAALILTFMLCLSRLNLFSGH